MSLFLRLRLSGDLSSCVSAIYAKKAPKPMLITAINVIIMVTDGGATASPITIPSAPVAKNNIMRNLALTGAMYLMRNV